MIQRPLRLLPALLLTVALAGLLMGCKFLPAKTIDSPSEGSPEWLVYKFIEGAQKEDTKEAWAAVRPLLHSTVTEMASSENSFLNLNLPAFRRKLRLLTANDKGEPHGKGATYKLAYTEEDQPDKEHRLFILNAASDMPSPFRVARDPKANNEWRVKTIP